MDNLQNIPQINNYRPHRHIIKQLACIEFRTHKRGRERGHDAVDPEGIGHSRGAAVAVHIIMQLLCTDSLHQTQHKQREKNLEEE
jgi:hypothetical protein